MKRILEYIGLLIVISFIVVGTVGAGGYLRQNTAVNVVLGPFLDESDGNTVESGLTISQADVRLSKSGEDFAQKNESTSCTYDEIGYYYCPINATDTNTLGRLKIAVHESGALAVWDNYVVLHANVYDVMFGAVAPSTLTASGVWGATVESSWTYEEYVKIMAGVLFGNMDYTSGTGVAIFYDVPTGTTPMVTETLSNDDRTVTDKYGD